MSLRIAAFGYHEVTDHPEESGFQRPRAVLYKHPVRTFKAHLDAIAAAGTPPELVHEIDFGGAGDHLVLTFDDGGRSASRISDELVRRGWRGHFLVVTGLSGQPTFLDRAGVLALRRAGHVVGSHSHSHPEVFRRLSMSAMLEQWRTSCDRLAQWLGEGCAVASVPGGEISDAVLESAQRSGIEYLFTSEPWLTPRRLGPCHILGRVSVKATTSVRRVAALAAFRSWQFARLERRTIVLARTLCPSAHQWYVHRRAGRLLRECAVRTSADDPT